MRLLYSLVIIGAPLALYLFVIRPRLGNGAGALREGVWARLKSFRTLVVGWMGLVAAELPMLLAELQLVSWGEVLPGDLARVAATLVIVALIAVRAFATTPGRLPPSAEA